MLLESSKFRSEEMPKRSRDKQRLAHLHREIQVCNFYSFFFHCKMYLTYIIEMQFYNCFISFIIIQKMNRETSHVVEFLGDLKLEEIEKKWNIVVNTLQERDKKIRDEICK